MLIDVTNPITNLLFPARCLLCNEDISKNMLCAPCSSVITTIPPKHDMLHDQKPALFFYEGTIKTLITNGKFYGGLQDAHELMKMAERAFRDCLAMTNFSRDQIPDCITAIPTHWFNRVRRGVDLPLLFALCISRILARPFVSCLRRQSYLHHQSRAANKTERIKGIRHAFALKSNQSVGHVLVIDDVVTTGATFLEAKKMLTDVSTKISFLAIARTP